MRRLLWLLAVALVACDAPSVRPTSDPRQSLDESRVEGNVVVQSHARGNVVLFLFNAARPPPPKGTGHPVSFVVVSQEALFGTDTSSAGPFSAPYTFSQVPPGQYIVQGFLDSNTCGGGTPGCRASDFNPYFRVTQEPNAGDVGGAAVDALTHALVPVTISKDKDGQLNVPTGVTVSISDVAAYPTDRPAFQVTNSLIYAPSATPYLLDLSPLPILQANVDERGPVFLVQFVDADGDGVPDDADGDGVPDLWPQVLVRKLSDVPPLLDDENDLDNNGVVDSAGLDYPHADGTEDGKPDAVILAAKLVPTGPIAALTDGMGHFIMTPKPVASLQIALLPAALDISGGLAAPQPLATIPLGRYSITLVEPSGQTWRIPNELGPETAGAADFDPIASQGQFVSVPGQ